MIVILCMTAITISWGGFKFCIQVAAITRNADVFSSQHKYCLVVVKGGRFPSLHGMTGITGGSQAASVDIILRMAAATIHWSPLVFTIDMTFFTGNIDMLSFKFKVSQVMVEFRWFPSIR